MARWKIAAKVTANVFVVVEAHTMKGALAEAEETPTTDWSISGHDWDKVTKVVNLDTGNEYDHPTDHDDAGVCQCCGEILFRNERGVWLSEIDGDDNCVDDLGQIVKHEPFIEEEMK